MVAVHDLYRNMGNFNIFKEFELLEVKVPIIFLGTEGFSHPRDAHLFQNLLIYYSTHPLSHVSNQFLL
jgi:hypothetical protein